MPNDMSDRQRWMSILAKASVDELYAGMQQMGGEDLSLLPPYRCLRPPEVGLAMVRGRAGGTGQMFNLGEITLARCVVQLTDELLHSGDRSDVPQPSMEIADEPITGFGYVAGRSLRHAELAAWCDALMQRPDWCDRVRQTILIPLQERYQQQREQDQHQTAATKVDFFTLLRGQ